MNYAHEVLYSLSGSYVLGHFYILDKSELLSHLASLILSGSYTVIGHVNVFAVFIK